MSAFKQFNRQDVYVTAYTARKSWSITGSLFATNAIKVLRGTSGSGAYFVSPADLENGHYKRLVWNSVNQLYYSNFSGSQTYTGSFDNFLETSFYSRALPISDDVVVVSVPRNLIGTHIEPGSFDLECRVSGSIKKRIRDDGEGVLYVTGSAVVGDIVYSHGIAVITDPVLASEVQDLEVYQASWKSNQPIYSYNFYCKVQDSEFNHTMNPSAISGSDGKKHNNITGSYFRPYPTTVGLYNSAHELVAVAKLGQPLPKSPDTDTVFVVKIDM